MTAVAAIVRMTPSNNRSIILKSCKSKFGGENLNYTGCDLVADTTTVTAITPFTPSHDGSIITQSGKGTPVLKFISGPKRLGSRNWRASQRPRTTSIRSGNSKAKRATSNIRRKNHVAAGYGRCKHSCCCAIGINCGSQASGNRASDY